MPCQGLFEYQGSTVRGSVYLSLPGSCVYLLYLYIKFILVVVPSQLVRHYTGSLSLFAAWKVCLRSMHITPDASPCVKLRLVFALKLVAGADVFPTLTAHMLNDCIWISPGSVANDFSPTFGQIEGLADPGMIKTA